MNDCARLRIYCLQVISDSDCSDSDSDSDSGSDADSESESEKVSMIADTMPWKLTLGVTAK